MTARLISQFTNPHSKLGDVTIPMSSFVTNLREVLNNMFRMVDARTP